jgi:hypothetical protein
MTSRTEYLAEAHLTALHPKPGPRTHTHTAAAAISPSPGTPSSTLYGGRQPPSRRKLMTQNRSPAPPPREFPAAPPLPRGRVTWPAGRWRGGGDRKGLAEADKTAGREGEALLGAVARAGLEGLAIKGRRWRGPSLWLRAIRVCWAPPRGLGAALLTAAVIFGSPGAVVGEAALPGGELRGTAVQRAGWRPLPRQPGGRGAATLGGLQAPASLALPLPGSGGPPGSRQRRLDAFWFPPVCALRRLCFQNISQQVSPCGRRWRE